jgi:hypothetical protein
MFPPSNNGATFSDADNMSAFSSREYLAMMQQCTSHEQLQTSFDLGGLPMSQYQDASYPGDMFTVSSGEHLPSSNLQIPLNQNVFDSPQETNRRTLTQEQFNALAQSGNNVQVPDRLNQTHGSQPIGTDGLIQALPPGHPWNHKEEPAVVFQGSFSDGPSSNDSSLPSNPADHSNYLTTSSVGDSASFSTSPVDWADSCSSSTSESQSQFTQQPLPESSQWHPGQSKPIELGLLQQQFREAQGEPQHASQPTHLSVEPTLAWSGDDDFLRRDSQNSVVLTQQMSQFALQTPQPQLHGQFKPPQQPASIAARRHVKRPAALSLRSTSYSGASGPASPSPGLKPGQQTLRRIQSSMTMNSVANGRVSKGSIGSAQRSPLNFTFSEAINSPNALRHASASSAAGSSLAPPTPLSPTEMTLGELGRPPHSAGWSSVGHLSRHTSISETDVEHTSGFMHGSTTSSQPTFSSPPSTPMFTSHPYQQFIQGRLGPTILENTPPQSAPASQSCFSASAYALPHQPTSMPPPPPPFNGSNASIQQTMQPLISPQNSHFINSGLTDEQYAIAMMPSFPGPQFALADYGVPPELSVSQFSLLPNGSSSGGQMGMSSVMPGPATSMQQPQYHPHVSNATEAIALQNQLYSPPPGQLHFTDSSNCDAHAEGNIHLHKTSTSSAPASELFVHEYSPPQEIKQVTLPRKAVDPGPKNYTFSNHGPEYFEKDKSKKGSVSSASPESFSGQ